MENEHKKCRAQNLEQEIEFLRNCITCENSYSDPDGYVCLYCALAESMFGYRKTEKVNEDGVLVISHKGWEIPCSQIMEFCRDGSCDLYESSDENAQVEL